MIRAVVVDDHAVVRSGIKLLLDREQDIEVVGEAGNAKDAIFALRALKPDVTLLDVVMPGESGIEVLPNLLKESPETKVLVLSMQDDPSYVREAFAAGASGYVLKEAADEEVVAAVREIAKMLYISVRTAETHRAHIMQKLRLSTRAELVRHALSQGLLEEER